MISMSEADVQFLCDRRSGLGADGLLRVVRASTIPEWQGDPNYWFMDYRNADGSVAEMCGNGLRVFVQYLLEENLVPLGEIKIATRAGERIAWPQPDGRITTTMGYVELFDTVTLRLGNREWQARKVNVGNPHAVVLLDPGERLEDLDLSAPVTWEPADAFPDGTNIEFVQDVGPRDIRVRVIERGVGETLSCGTGVVAAAIDHADRHDLISGGVSVTVRGGHLQVGLDGEVTLTGPAVIVARGDVSVPDA